MQQPWLPLNNDQPLTASCFCNYFFPFFLAIKRKCMHTGNYVHLLKNCTIFTSPCLLHVNFIISYAVDVYGSYRCTFLIFAAGTVIFWVCVIINSLKKHRPQCYTYISALCTDKQRMCDPILVNLLKMRAHYSQSSRENVTPSSSTFPLASYMEVPPPGFF